MNASVRAGRAVTLVLAALALIAALAVAAFGAVAPASAQQATVEIVDFSFSPSSIQVTAGTTVTWINSGAVSHTATGDAFDTGTIAPGGSASITFDTPGTFTYICSIHPNMTGSVVVTAAPAPAADDTDDTDDTTDTGATTTTTTGLPSTGTGAAFGGGATSPLVAGLLALAALFGAAGVALRRRASA